MAETLYNLNMERAVLSAVIFDPDLLDELSSKIDATTFYLPFHQYVFNAMVELSREERPIDEEFLQQRLRMYNKFDEVAMLDMLSANPISNIDAYLQVLVEMSKRRSLATMATEIKKLVIEDALESVDVLSRVDKRIDEISAYGSKAKNKTSSDYVGEVMDAMSKAQESGGIVGYKSGIYSVDGKIGAFQGGDLVVIAARPSMGKTSLMTTITDYALSCGHGVYMNSLEMSGQKIMARLIATRAKEPLKNIKGGAVSDFESFKAATNFYKNNSLLHIDEESYVTIQEIKAKAVMAFRKNPDIKYWFLDHLRYIKKPGVNIANEVSEITKELKRVAKQYDVVVFLLSQLNRANEQRTSKRPMLSDLRESGAIEEDADIVIFPHRDSYYQRNQSQAEPPMAEAELIIGKNRDGEAGVCKCYFHGETASFRNHGEVVYEYSENSGHTYEMPVV